MMPKFQLSAIFVFMLVPCAFLAGWSNGSRQYPQQTSAWILAEEMTDKNAIKLLGVFDTQADAEKNAIEASDPGKCFVSPLDYGWRYTDIVRYTNPTKGYGQTIRGSCSYYRGEIQTTYADEQPPQKGGMRGLPPPPPDQQSMFPPGVLIGNE